METKIELQGLALQTLVGDNQRAHAYYSTRYENSYVIELKSANGVFLGFMTAVIVEEDRDIVPFEHPYKNCKYLYINHMENSSRLKHVGSALHEYAFRMSIAFGAQGRVRFIAVRNSHIFHLKNGFLMEGELDSNYCQELIEEMLIPVKSAKDLGSKEMYLPRKRINENMKKYGLEENLLSPSPEIIGEVDKLNYVEKILLEIQQKSLAIRIIIGLKKGFTPTADTSKDFFNKNPGACCYTQVLINKGVKILRKQLPIDTEEKRQSFLLTLAGIIIYVMAYQDRKYGKQSIFNDELLFPQRTYLELLDDYDDYGDDLFVRLGEDALVNKKLSFDGTLKPKVFFGLQAIPEFPSLFNKFLIKEEIAEEQTIKCGL